MERLTIDEIIEHCDRKTGMYEKACDVKYLETAVMGNRIKEYWEHKQVSEYLRKLKDYEDLEEHGRLVKMGDVLYSYYYGYSKALDDLLNSLPDCDYVGIEHLVCLVERLKRGEENDG